MASTYTELIEQLRGFAITDGNDETKNLLFAAAYELERVRDMCAAAEAKQKLLRLAQITQEAEQLSHELYKDWFSDFMEFGVTQILYNCTIDSEGLKNAAGELLSRDGRCMDEPLGYFVNQSCGYCEDDFYGTMYVSVDDKGTFVAVDYQC